MVYDFEYTQTIFEKINLSFVKTPIKIIDENKKTEKKLISWWNKAFNKIGLKIKNNNVCMTSIKKMFLGDPHKAHKIMLNNGIDAYTLRLYLTQKDNNENNSLADFIKILVYSFKIAESNDRTVEASNFTFIVANDTRSVLKSTLVNTSIILAVSIILFVN